MQSAEEQITKTEERRVESRDLKKKKGWKEKKKGGNTEPPPNPPKNMILLLKLLQDGELPFTGHFPFSDLCDYVCYDFIK